MTDKIQIPDEAHEDDDDGFLAQRMKIAEELINDLAAPSTPPAGDMPPASEATV